METPHRPPRQSSYRFPIDYHDKTKFKEYGQSIALWFKRLSIQLDLDPNNIHTITELGCGIGAITMGLLYAFPQSVIQAIDYWDDLLPTVKHDPRVIFHHGLFTKVLEEELL